MEPSSIEKIMEIDAHVGCAMSGLTADSRTMIDHARVEAQVSPCRQVPCLILKILFSSVVLDTIWIQLPEFTSVFVESLVYIR